MLIVECKIDTGAECNVISESTLQLLNHKLVKPSSTTLKTYGGKKLPTVGKVKIKCKFNSVEIDTYFHVVDMNVKTILGLDSCFKLKFVNPRDERNAHHNTPQHVGIIHNCDGNNSPQVHSQDDKSAPVHHTYLLYSVKTWRSS